MANATKVDLPTARRTMERHARHLKRAAMAVAAIEGTDEYVVRALYDRVRDASDDAWEIENLHDDAVEESGHFQIAYLAAKVRLAGEGAIADPLAPVGSFDVRWRVFQDAAKELATAIDEWFDGSAGGAHA